VKFTINQDLLFHHSPTFKACFESQWEEGQSKSVRLDEVDEETFGMVQHWLYKGKLIFGGDSEPEPQYLVLLSKVWNFGDKYLIAPLQNDVIDVIHYILADEYLDSPKELKDFIDHAFPIFENNNDQHGNRIGESADLGDCNMVQLLIVHKFALGHWGMSDVELREWIEGNHLPYSVLGKVSMVLMKNTLYGTLEAQRTRSLDSDNYHVQQR